MKVVFAVILAIILLVIGWIILAVILSGIGFLLYNAREDTGLMDWLNMILVWILSPGFGGFLATYVTPRVFKNIDVKTITTSFITVIVTLFVAMFTLLLIQKTNAEISEHILFVSQIVAIVVGAKIGKSMHIGQYA